MVYIKKDPSEVERISTRVNPGFLGCGRMQFKITSLPMAVASYILDSIGFTGIVDSALEWDPKQCIVTPGDAIKAMVLTMVMGGYRPALENVWSKFKGQPLQLYFDSVTDCRQFDPDMLARMLTRLHESDDVALFMTVATALRTRYGLKTKACHSDTTSVSVEGAYDRYDPEGRALIRNSDGNLVFDENTIEITRGYSKDKRPDLLQYMIGEAVDENGVPILSKPLDGNTADSKWNAECLELLKDVLKEENIAYVADSKVVNDPLVSTMVSENIRFLSRCPSNFHHSLLSRSLMDFDLDDLKPIENLSARKNAAKRRIVEGSTVFEGTVLRTVLVETSTLAGKGEKAVAKQKALTESRIAAFDNVFNCEKDARDKTEKFLKSLSKGICDIGYRLNHEVVESRPRGRPRADGADIRRADRWTVEFDCTLNETKAEELRRREGYIMLISNIPSREDDPEHGMDAKELVTLYGKEWRVEASFHTKKRPILVERLFMKDPGRAQALVTVVNLACLLRAIIQVLLRKGLESIPDEDLPHCGRGMGVLQRNVTTDFFVDSCTNCYIQYDPSTNGYMLFGDDEDIRAKAFLNLLGIPPDRLFATGRGEINTP
ncbi:MAG: IS1634 family transposase [archaeon]|nr:IS1634 family transposase [archaeon]